MFSGSIYRYSKSILRLGEWIRNSELYEEYMHPIILPKKSNIMELTGKCCHVKQHIVVEATQ